MGEVVKLSRDPAASEVERLIGALEAGGLIAYLMVPETDATPAFVAFEFNDPVVTQEGMVAAHVFRDRFNSDAAFKDSAAEYMFSVGAIYSAGTAA